MGRVANQLAVIQHQNVVGALHAGRALGDDKHGHAVRFLFDCLAQGCVRCKIQRRGTIIQNQDLRLWYQRAGNRQALTLAAGEVAARRLHRRIQHAGFAADKLRRLGYLQRLPDFLVGSAGGGPLHIVADRTCKQHGLLGHDPPQPAQLCKAVLLYIMAEQRNAAVVGIVEAAD